MTPIIQINLPDFHNSLYIKREDLLPFSFGGNKVRIAQEFIIDMKKQGKNCIIGYGNARSNLSRALANLCFSENIPCYIISPSDDDGNRIETSNSLLVKKCGVIFYECSKSNVAQAVDTVIKMCQEVGLKPYYIYGDRYGNGNEAVPLDAYKKAYVEIKKQAESLHTEFDYIFLATGTGMTQSGLLLGKKLNHGKEKIIGISVARNTEKETEVIKKFLQVYKNTNGINLESDYEIIVNDDYLYGGYGVFNQKINDFIIEFFSKYGIPLDPTYTGKAFYGMLNYLQKNEIEGKKVLFIHTGGTPLFFDFIKRSESFDIFECSNKEKIIEFLKSIDNCLPTPLSKRVDLEKYACKVLQNGKILAIEKENKIIAAILFYCNDLKSKYSYITLIGTLPEYQSNGYANALLKAAEEISITNKMISCRLETEFSNSSAISFYCRNGYIVEFADNKLHMIKELIK